MAKRSSNILSRALERQNQSGGNGDAAAEKAIHRTDGQSAKILPMPNRRLPDLIGGGEPTTSAANNEKSGKPAGKLIEKSVTPENWQWSAPPEELQKKLGEPSASQAAGETSALVSTSPRPFEANGEIVSETMLETVRQAIVPITPADRSTALVEAKPANHRVTAPPKFRAVEINTEAVEPHLVAITQPRSVHSEEFRNLRTQILHASQRQKLQAITIASGNPSEGKSTVALNLAWLLAQTDGITALIIDSDLRLPCLADYLGVEAKPGLSEIFSNEVRLEDAIVRLEPSGLHLLPGGAARDDVAEMLSGNRFRTVLEQTRKMFDYIIVDAPSLGIFTDAAVLINQTDAALLVVRAGKTKYQTTSRLLETLPRERILGVVLNGSQGEMQETHYDHYYNSLEKRN